MRGFSFTKTPPMLICNDHRDTTCVVTPMRDRGHLRVFITCPECPSDVVTTPIELDGVYVQEGLL